MEFRNTWQSMKEKRQEITHIDPKEPSLVEISPKLDIPTLLQSMTKADALGILGFNGYDVEEDGELEVLSTDTVFEDETSDAIDRFEEAKSKAEEEILKSVSNKEKSSPKSDSPSIANSSLESNRTFSKEKVENIGPENSKNEVF